MCHFTFGASTEFYMQNMVCVCVCAMQCRMFLALVRLIPLQIYLNLCVFECEWYCWSERTHNTIRSSSAE